MVEQLPADITALFSSSKCSWSQVFDTSRPFPPQIPYWRPFPFFVYTWHGHTAFSSAAIKTVNINILTTAELLHRSTNNTRSFQEMMGSGKPFTIQWLQLREGDNDVEWTTNKELDWQLCVPAAFSDKILPACGEVSSARPLPFQESIHRTVLCFVMETRSQWKGDSVRRLYQPLEMHNDLISSVTFFPEFEYCSSLVFWHKQLWSELLPLPLD